MIRKKRSASPLNIQASEITPASLAEQLDETLSAKRRRIDDNEYKLTPIQDRLNSSKAKNYFQVNNSLTNLIENLSF